MGMPVASVTGHSSAEHIHSAGSSTGMPACAATALILALMTPVVGTCSCMGIERNISLGAATTRFVMRFVGCHFSTWRIEDQLDSFSHCFELCQFLCQP